MLKSVWSERYRPSRLENISGQDEIVAELQSVVAGDSSPQHYLFHSEGAGTGKTSVARAFAKEMGWPIHEFNASTKKLRGIEFVEDELIPLSSCGSPDIIFLLDECDQLTPAAQSALKGVIENTSGTFILTCNDLSKVSDWIKSRCAVREFKPIKQDWMMYTLSHIAMWENEVVTEEQLSRICKHWDGDLRGAINALQSLCCFDEEGRERFSLSLLDEGLDCTLFLRLLFRDQDIESACAMLEGRNIRKAIRTIFQFAISDEASPKSKMLITEAAIIAERDCINGVNEEIVKWAFCTILCGGFIGKHDRGQFRTER